MGAVTKFVKKMSRRAGYYAGGVIGESYGKLTGSSMGEKIGRRVGHQLGKSAGRIVGTAASKVIEKVPVIGSMKKGGPIHRTGNYLLHKGEYVLNKRKASRMKHM